ncbi:MAG: methylmalonyl-CoA decarboxylase [Bacteroidetes bacterium]|jgi:methylmalonyl-CoA decarboxylase|nr:methylmalonyl-CoA decarboxylase [Bacteroidota bacterium]|tara:strand:- start:895 stop:1674 length:780 start_codon:yes stop_codon:yes gene_type:complete
MKFIKISIIDDVATITFNNDSKSNALSFEMLKEIEQSLDKFSDKNVRVVIIRSNPDAKVWSAGLDINELPEPGKDPLPYSHPLEELMRKIEDHNAPIIAMVTGSVWGGGFDFAVTCDMIIGSPSCSFAITPAKIGVPYNATGLLHFLNVVEINIAKELFFTANPINATRAYNLGIINNLVDDDEIESFTFDLAQKITSNSPYSISVIKEQLNLLGKARPMTPSVFERINDLRRKAYNSYDFVEGKNAFLEKRRPIFRGE